MRNSSAKRLLLTILMLHTFASGYGGPPAQSTIFYREGAEFFKQGNIASAELKFRESAKLSPSYSLAHYGLGRVYLVTEGKNDEAIKSLRKSVELDPGLAKGYFYLGLAELIGERYIEAIHSFKDAYDRDRGFVEALYNIAVIYDHLGNSYRAFVYYRQYVNETEK